MNKYDGTVSYQKHQHAGEESLLGEKKNLVITFRCPFDLIRKETVGLESEGR